jgi:fructokinase
MSSDISEITETASGPREATAESRPSGRVIVFGEVLFDCFADGQEVPGGAPFNVAWHLQGFGLRPIMVSRVGADARGRRIRRTMADWGMALDALQEDADRPTGVVNATVERGQPTFRIEPDQAYDFIDAGEALAAGQGGASLLYHGSLALRNATSRRSLERLRATSRAPTFIDVNLRDPWWERGWVETLLQGAAWVKLNEVELGTLTARDCSTVPFCIEAGRILAERWAIATLIVTRGAEGAVLVPRGGEPVAADPHPVDTLVDTIGAGDAFAAVSILGVLRGWTAPVLLQRASFFAARICGIQGATRSDRELYEDVAGPWQSEDGSAPEGFIP